MNNIISLDERLKLSTAQKAALVHKQKIQAVRKIIQCTHCASKCERCGTSIGLDPRENSRHGSLFPIISAIAAPRNIGRISTSCRTKKIRIPIGTTTNGFICGASGSITRALLINTNGPRSSCVYWMNCAARMTAGMNRRQRRS